MGLELKVGGTECPQLKLRFPVGHYVPSWADFPTSLLAQGPEEERATAREDSPKTLKPSSQRLMGPDAVLRHIQPDLKIKVTIMKNKKR